MGFVFGNDQERRLCLDRYHDRVQRRASCRRRCGGGRSGNDRFCRPGLAGDAGHERGANWNLFLWRMNSNEEPIIEVVDLVRKFGDRAVIDDISFDVLPGETLVIMGGSGCGKSTLLRHIIGVMKPTAGSIKIFDDEITTMNDRRLDDVRRRFGMLFQSGALLASLTVGENVALPLWQHTDMSAEEIQETVAQKLQAVGLNGFENLKPAEISGGMRKRVGLARALALDP